MTYSQLVGELESLSDQARLYRDASAVVEADDALVEKLKEVVAAVEQWWIEE